jgi:hypothetical protein
MSEWVPIWVKYGDQKGSGNDRKAYPFKEAALAGSVTILSAGGLGWSQFLFYTVKFWVRPPGSARIAWGRVSERRPYCTFSFWVEMAQVVHELR